MIAIVLGRFGYKTDFKLKDKVSSVFKSVCGISAEVPPNYRPYGLDAAFSKARSLTAGPLVLMDVRQIMYHNLHWLLG